ncbi:unnamed protein product [Linum trigynum]|uniref:Uncharacterized protein n=1 Tax=Linum trigynum TaxID=586398 RepID=A0AAV2DAD2_9ROSI
MSRPLLSPAVDSNDGETSSPPASPSDHDEEVFPSSPCLRVADITKDFPAATSASPVSSPTSEDSASPSPS